MLGILFLRKMLGLTGEEFGKRLGVSKGTISQWESGARGIPESKKRMIQAEYGCPKDLLCKDIGESDKLEIQYCILKSKNEMVPVHDEDKEKKIKQIEEEAWNERIESIIRATIEQPQILDYFEKMARIFLREPEGINRKTEKTKYVIELLLKSADIYVHDKKYLERNRNEKFAIEAIVAILTLVFGEK